MDITPRPDNPQAALWNGHAGRAWVETQALLDDLFRPFEALLVEAVRSAAAHHVLDIGCGSGSTTLYITRELGAGGHGIGVDISEPMITAARARARREASPAQFIVADAQRYAFEPASIDMIVSRFGVMFFDQPITAFANLRRAAREGAELCCIAWRSAAENPFMTTAERTAAPLLPNLPARQPNAPGQFAFADPERVTTILATGGWADIELQPIDVACTLPESGLASYVSRLGPVGLALQDTDEHTRAQVIDKVRSAFAPYVHGPEVRFTAACWLIRARAQPVSVMAKDTAHV